MIHFQALAQIGALKQMMIFSLALISLGFNLLIIFTIILLIRVIQRMNKFEKVIKWAKWALLYPQELSKKKLFPKILHFFLQKFQFIQSNPATPTYLAPTSYHTYSPAPHNTERNSVAHKTGSIHKMVIKQFSAYGGIHVVNFIHLF